MDLLESRWNENKTQELTPEDMSTILGNLIIKVIHQYHQHFFEEQSKWNFNLNDKKILLGIFQEEDPKLCDGLNVSSSKNFLDDPSALSISIPHPQDSGRCFTYK